MLREVLEGLRRRLRDDSVCLGLSFILAVHGTWLWIVDVICWGDVLTFIWMTGRVTERWLGLLCCTCFPNLSAPGQQHWLPCCIGQSGYLTTSEVSGTSSSPTELRTGVLVRFKV